MSQAAGLVLPAGEDARRLAEILSGPAGASAVSVYGFIDLLSRIAVIVLLFLVGLETSVREMHQLGRTSLLVAVVGVVVPAANAGSPWSDDGSIWIGFDSGGALACHGPVPERLHRDFPKRVIGRVGRVTWRAACRGEGSLRQLAARYSTSAGTVQRCVASYRSILKKASAAA